MARSIAFFIVLLLVGLFALLNWDAFSAATTLNLGVTTVQAPLGLIMLGLVAFLCVLFTAWVIAMQAGTLIESRRQTRELQAQRDLADRAEASRFTALRSELMTRLDRLQIESQLAAEQNANAISAQLGQIEDRLEAERGLVAPRR